MDWISTIWDWSAAIGRWLAPESAMIEANRLRALRGKTGETMLDVSLRWR